MATNIPADWNLIEGDEANGIYESRNWCGYKVYNLVMGGNYLTYGYDADVAAIYDLDRDPVKYGKTCTLADLRQRLAA